MSRRLASTISALLAVPALLSAWPAAADDAGKSDKPGDYAFALPLQIYGKQGVVAVRLPTVLYLNARTANLADLRVFDTNDVAQPFAIQPPPAESTTQRTMRPVTIFPIRHAGSDSTDANIDLDIRTRADGSVVSVSVDGLASKTTASSTPSRSDGKLTGLVLDLGPMEKDASGAPERIAALRFAPPPGHASYNAEIWLETSDDLKHWQTIGAADIGWLTSTDQQTLSNDRLDFPPQAFRYARLTWHSGDPVEFPSIEAEHAVRQPVATARETLWLKPGEARVGSDLAYRTSVALPVDRIDLRFTDANIVYPMILGRYAERPSRVAGKEWIFIPEIRATFYQIEQESGKRQSAPLTLTASPAAQHQGEWIIRPQNARATAKPELGLSWRPSTLVFVAGGQPPYQLHFGRSDATPAAQPLAQVAPGFSDTEIRQLELAGTGELRTVNPQASAGNMAEQAADAARKRVLALWSLLVLGVAVLAGMTWKLLRQMNNAAKERDPGKS